MITILNPSSSPTMEWPRFPITRIETIDRQHQLLLHRLIELQVDIQYDKSMKEIKAMLSSLEVLFLEHFSTEETYMVNTACPCYQHHFDQHSAFISRYFLNIKNDILEKQIFNANTMIRWWTTHIQQDDTLMADHLRQYNAQNIGKPVSLKKNRKNKKNKKNN